MKLELNKHIPPIAFVLALAISSVSQVQASSCGVAAPLSDQSFASGGSAQFYQDKGCFPDGVEEKVFLQNGTIAIGDTGYGSVGLNNSDEDMLFTSITDILDMKNGAGTIKSDSADGVINDLTIASAEGYWFTDLIVNTLNVVTTGNLWVTAYKLDGTSVTYNYNTIGGGAGANEDIMVYTDDTHFKKINLASNSGFVIDSACSTTLTEGEACGIEQVKQIEVSGYGVVPIPAAVWLFGSGLLGLVGMARRRKTETA